MANLKTAIEWTDRTWNPVTGCTKVSPGCANCYAERITNRFAGPDAFDKVVLHPERLEDPLRWKKTSRVFVNSMSDLFHECVPDGFLDAAFSVMARRRLHTFQILTKRAERVRNYFADPLTRIRVAKAIAWNDIPQWPLPNVWLGVSVENQRFADERIPLLLQTPAAVRFISVEPMLGPVDLFNADGDGLRGGLKGALDWVICGGESGPGARPLHPNWARALRDQCQSAGVPFFFKQWGGRTPKAGGRLLDGREWNEFPKKEKEE